MPTKLNLTPLAGIDNRQEDEALMVGGESPRVYVREALNVDLSETGRMTMRGAVDRVTGTPYRNLWVSPLHGDLFGTLGSDWVRIKPADWSHEVLADLGGEWASHCVMNHLVVCAGAAGIFAFDGQSARPLPLATPGQPFVQAEADGSLAPGDYGVAVAWLRGTLESSVSATAFVALPEGGGLTVAFPYAIDGTVTAARLYMTKPGSRELQRLGDFPVAQGTVEVPAPLPLGAPPQFQHLDEMPTGRFLQHWRGRLLTASTKTLHFSEPMAGHLHDRRHGFVQFPQRITFVQPVDGGIWVGQVDHVVFLSGNSPDVMELHRRAAQAPVPGSATLLPAGLAGELAGAGTGVAIWLAANGYVAGTGEGQLVEMHRQRLHGIRAAGGASTVWGHRILTLLG